VDEFDKKHEVVQHLMDMLKGHAVGEVEGGMHKPTAVVVAHGMPGHDPMCKGEAMCSGGVAKMSDGGMAASDDEPEREHLPAPTDGPSDDAPDMTELHAPMAPVKSHDTDVEDEDDENNQSFMGLMKKVKK
jgi:hypothetical protein